jgi:hypothetical protein
MRYSLQFSEFCEKFGYSLFDPASRIRWQEYEAETRRINHPDPLPKASSMRWIFYPKDNPFKDWYRIIWPTAEIPILKPYIKSV